MYHSPGIEYSCPQCRSTAIRFIFDEKYSEWFEMMRSISARKIKLSNLYKDYKTHPNSIKWMCYKCKDCGVVQKI